MTSVVAWERTVGPLSELVVASDSRLSGGEDWDACAKIFDIGRDDALLAFAGDTHRALPLVLQAIATTRSYRGSLLRTLDLPHFAGHLKRVLNAVLSTARGPAAEDPPDCEFLLGGWSWRMGKFRIYRYVFDPSSRQFFSWASRGLPQSIDGRGQLYASIGDGSRRLSGRIAREYNWGRISDDLDYHPLEQLYQQAIDTGERSVGGPVQVSKVYRSIRVEHFATEAEGNTFVSGRPVLPAENIDLRTLVRSSSGTWRTLSPRDDRVRSAPACDTDLTRRGG